MRKVDVSSHSRRIVDTILLSVLKGAPGSRTSIRFLFPESPVRSADFLR